MAPTWLPFLPTSSRTPQRAVTLTRPPKAGQRSTQSTQPFPYFAHWPGGPAVPVASM